ncbi:hypothetical protein PVMG_05080 [Plasmodium vivax Mauritania I]|uniref:Uncharacterized protein n=1 Tax=Plasmodium vivax Mauritania I TaxID=1035515 RepID=A0A0J9TK65_PLAVI|nr:hypothetical protein PVMG_05080 [Plasmodium vivax Mauritania I]
MVIYSFLYKIIKKITFILDLYQKKILKELLKTLTLYELYNSFEKELKRIPNVDTCNERCGAKLTEGSKEGLDLLKLCKVICNIILEVIDNNGIYKESTCSGSFIYMNIWLYERVRQIATSDSEINKFYEALNSINKIKVLESKYCFIINFTPQKNGFMNMKYLYEFLHIYEDMKNEISADLSAKDQLYCSYIKEFFKYYNSIEGNCTSEVKGPIYCNVIEKYKLTFTDNDTLDSIYNKCNFDKIQCEGDTSVKNVFPCLKMKENLLKNEPHSDYIKNIVSTLYSAILPFISISGILLIFYKVNMIYF